jgi:hypothetical protein
MITGLGVTLGEFSGEVAMLSGRHTSKIVGHFLAELPPQGRVTVKMSRVRQIGLLRSSHGSRLSKD